MWVCDSCGYKQDFPPSKESHDLHFNSNSKYALSDLGSDECPSCRLNGVCSTSFRAVKDGTSQIVVLEESDLPEIIAKLDKSPREDGETDEQHRVKIERAKKELRFLSHDELSALKEYHTNN